MQTPGTLTIGTDSPAFPPWFEDDDPANGRGFESAVAYAVAEQLGFSRTRFSGSRYRSTTPTLPEPKDFDFDINQISITPTRLRSSTSPTATTPSPRRSSP